jgi:hypothetical protein
MGRGWIAAAAATAVLLGSCSLLQHVQRLGVSSQEGDLVVHYVPCPGQAVAAVRASLGDPDEGGQVIWEITRAPGPSPVEARGEQTYALGSVPDLFRESVSLEETPAPDAEVVVEVGVISERGGTSTLSLTFAPGSLEPGRILTLGGSKDPATYREEALTTCEG